MSMHKLFNLIAIMGLLVFSLVALPSKPVSSQTGVVVFTDFPSFAAATGPLTEINFENLPPSASSKPGPGQQFIPNPLVLEGIVFSDAYSLQTSFCSSPTCQPDPHNLSGGNITLSLNQDAAIKLPVGTGGAMLVVEGMGDMPFTVRVIDSGGGSLTVNGQATLGAASFLGFTSTNGIQRIEVVGTGPTASCPQSPCGPLALSTVYVELADPNVTGSVWTDPAYDVSISNGDVTFGSATVSDGLIDLRAQFLALPFLNADVHRITWCLDTDRNAATGSACGLDMAGADRAVTLAGTRGALLGGDLIFEGDLAGLDPCAVGSFNWDSNTLRLLLPISSVLTYSDTFNYVVTSTLVSASSNLSDQAPDSANFGMANGFFTSVTGEPFPFNGAPLCSSNLEASMVITPQATGTIRTWPELGIAPEVYGDWIQSTYFKTTSVNREFRRGFFEFAIPEFPGQVTKASLILTEERAQVYAPVPADEHELAYHQPADLIVSTDDFTRTMTLLALFDTDANLPTQVFSFDITELITQSVTNTIGFRVKLAVDPTFDAEENFGSGFGGFWNNPPRMLVKTVDAQAVMNPTATVTLVYTDPQGLTTQVYVPPGAVTETAQLLYTAKAAAASSSLGQTSAAAISADPGRIIPNRAFVLDAYKGGARQPRFVPEQPFTVTVHYSDADVAALDESTLTLNSWNGNRWEYAACGPYERHLDENWLAVPVCRTSEFALFGMVHRSWVYLPLVMKNH